MAYLAPGSEVSGAGVSSLMSRLPTAQWHWWTQWPEQVALCGCGWAGSRQQFRVQQVGAALGASPAQHAAVALSALGVDRAREVLQSDHLEGGGEDWPNA